ncbi:MAG: hypothetical protein OEW53_08750, partial [Actinomycetota bacterium]|nr:hypothetical protein [Actinomycetota bacterium]
MAIRNRLVRSGRDDRGSMLLALSGVLVVTGIMMAFLVTVLIAQDSTRHDYRYTKSIQGADAGVQQAYYQINTLPTGSTSTSLSSGGTVML